MNELFQNVKKVAFYDWGGKWHVMDEDFTRKYLKLLKLNEKALYKTDDCQCEIKAGKPIVGQLIVCGSKKIVFKYIKSGFFRKKEKTFGVDYPDVVGMNLQGAKLHLELKNKKKLIFILPGNAGDEVFNILKNTENPEYVDLPPAIRTVRFLSE